MRRFNMEMKKNQQVDEQKARIQSSRKERQESKKKVEEERLRLIRE